MKPQCIWGQIERLKIFVNELFNATLTEWALLFYFSRQISLAYNNKDEQ